MCSKYLQPGSDNKRRKLQLAYLAHPDMMLRLGVPSTGRAKETEKTMTHTSFAIDIAAPWSYISR